MQNVRENIWVDMKCGPQELLMCRQTMQGITNCANCQELVFAFCLRIIQIVSKARFEKILSNLVPEGKSGRQNVRKHVLLKKQAKTGSLQQTVYF